eukprot:scaffold57779_cov30-Tisochrysis_lutea.AAC.9
MAPANILARPALTRPAPPAVRVGVGAPAASEPPAVGAPAASEPPTVPKLAVAAPVMTASSAALSTAMLAMLVSNLRAMRQSRDRRSQTTAKPWLINRPPIGAEGYTVGWAKACAQPHCVITAVAAPSRLNDAVIVSSVCAGSETIGTDGACGIDLAHKAPVRDGATFPCLVTNALREWMATAAHVSVFDWAPHHPHPAGKGREVDERAAARTWARSTHC